MSKLYEILNKIIPTDNQHYVEQKKLVWTNPNPTATFNAQTLSISGITTSDVLEVEFKDEERMIIQRFAGDGRLIAVGGSTDPREIWMRSFTLSSGSVAFTTCTEHLVGGTTTTTNNGRIIPQKIYKITKLGE